MSPATPIKGLPNKLSPHVCAGVALATLAGFLIGRWSEFWRSSTEFGHGWAVPLLAAYLAWEYLADRPVIGAAKEMRPASIHRWFCGASLLLAGVSLAGMRWMLEAFPTWPAMLWLFSIAGWSTAFFVISRIYGWAIVRHFAFPLLFTATALPWPTWMEVHLVLPLRTAIAAVAAEVIHWIGYPAITHGTVIEVGSGQVGVDEACSGIRSLQTVIMIALFLGALFKLGTGRRMALLAVGILLALLTNLARTCILAWQSAAHGAASIEAWHDPVGYAQMGVALGALAWLAWRWESIRKHPAPAPSEVSRPVGSHPLAVALIVSAFIVTIEIGTKLWFSRDDSTPSTPAWQVVLPANHPSYQEDVFTSSMQALLQCDSHKIGHWQNHDGARRAGYVLEWNRGDIARQTIALHNPEVCLPASGQKLVRLRETITTTTGPSGATLPFRAGEFADDTGVFYVFYLAWDTSHGRALPPANDESLSSWLAFRLNEVRLGRSRFNARVVALAIYGAPDFDSAATAFRREFQELLQRPDANQLNH